MHLQRLKLGAVGARREQPPALALHLLRPHDGRITEGGRRRARFGLGEGVHVAVGVGVGGSVPAAPAPTLDVEMWCAAQLLARCERSARRLSGRDGAGEGVASPSCKLSTRSNTPMVISVTAIIATRKKPSSAPGGVRRVPRARTQRWGPA